MEFACMRKNINTLGIRRSNDLLIRVQWGLLLGVADKLFLNKQIFKFDHTPIKLKIEFNHNITRTLLWILCSPKPSNRLFLFLNYFLDVLISTRNISKIRYWIKIKDYYYKKYAMLILGFVRACLLLLWSFLFFITNFYGYRSF